MNKVIHSFLMLAVVTFLCGTGLNAQRAIFVEENYADEDFDLSNAELPSWEIIPGGPGKDGIPALTDPHFTTARSDKWLKEEDLVIGVTMNGVAKAYPIRVLNYHEVINDDFKGQRVAITYSPLCGSAMAYRTSTHDQQWEMAVSGLLYNNNALYFDRETESLWSQVLGRAVAGPAAGAQLDLLPTTLTTWAEWQERYPETLLLAEETGYTRNYEMDAYAHYGTTDRLMFPLNHNDERMQIKDRILGLEVDGIYKAYSYNMLNKAENHITKDIINGLEVSIEFVPAAQAAYVTDLEGNALPSASMYWFSWSAAHPNTEIYELPTSEFQTTLSMSIGD